jgi:hypothetical protein
VEGAGVVGLEEEDHAWEPHPLGGEVDLSRCVPADSALSPCVPVQSLQDIKLACFGETPEVPGAGIDFLRHEWPRKEKK